MDLQWKFILLTHQKCDHKISLKKRLKGSDDYRQVKKSFQDADSALLLELFPWEKKKQQFYLLLMFVNADSEQNVNFVFEYEKYLFALSCCVPPSMRQY